MSESHWSFIFFSFTRHSCSTHVETLQRRLKTRVSHILNYANLTEHADLFRHEVTLSPLPFSLSIQKLKSCSFFTYLLIRVPYPMMPCCMHELEREKERKMKRKRRLKEENLRRFEDEGKRELPFLGGCVYRPSCVRIRSDASCMLLIHIRIFLSSRDEVIGYVQSLKPLK